MPRIKINRDELEKLSPEDALPLIIRLRKWVLGKQKPDGFTRWVFTINLIAWFLLMIWNLLSYLAIQMSDFIKEHKNFSVNAIIRKHGRELGFIEGNGESFLQAVTQFYFINIFLWFVVFLGLVMMYRKLKIYPMILLGTILLHFVVMLWMLGLQYFIESVSYFDKLLYGLLVISVILHSTLMNIEKSDKQKYSYHGAEEEGKT
jgi:hypothetical protein